MMRAEVEPITAALLVQDIPLIDLRAPIEFAQGAFPAALNMPLMSDEERAQVGLCYKKSGQAAAIALGHQLVAGELREARIAAWLAQIQAHPETRLYCFRGGLRSQTVQQWLAERGCKVARIDGGYKAMRQYLLATIESTSSTVPLTVVAGTTGSGKTELLQRLNNAIDLEAIACHRGSSFGGLPGGQPPQISVENRIAIEMLKLQASGEQELVLEDESRMIGKSALPEPLFNAMAQAPLVLLEASREERVQRIRHDYVDGMWQRFFHLHDNDDEKAQLALREFLTQSLARLARRLGGLHFRQLNTLLDEALLEQFATGNSARHALWIELLLSHYYDPIYLKFMQARADRTLFRGEMAACIEFLAHRRTLSNRQ